MSLFNTGILQQIKNIFRKKEVTFMPEQTGNGSSSEYDVDGYETALISVTGDLGGAYIRVQGRSFGVDHQLSSFKLPSFNERTENSSMVGYGAIKNTGLYLVRLRGHKKVRVTLLSSSGTTNVTVKGVLSKDTTAIPTEVHSSRSESVLYSKDNPANGTVSTDYTDPPTSGGSWTRIYIPHIVDANGNPFNVFDQSIKVISTFDADITVRLEERAISTGYTLNTPLNGAFHILIGTTDLGAGVREVVFQPKEDPNISQNNGITVFEIPSLAQPSHGFHLLFRLQSSPSSGELKVIVNRRF